MTVLLAQQFRNDEEKRIVIPENAKHLSGIQGIYFWIPDIPPAAEFRNDGASRATIPE